METLIILFSKFTLDKLENFIYKVAYEKVETMSFKRVLFNIICSEVFKSKFKDVVHQTDMHFNVIQSLKGGL